MECWRLVWSELDGIRPLEKSSRSSNKPKNLRRQCSESQIDSLAGLVYFALAAAILTLIVTRNLTATGETLVYVGRNTTVLGALTVADQRRKEAIQAVGELKRQGYRTVLLSGDSSEAASAIGAQLRVHEAIGNLLPEQKLEKVREFLRQGRKVAMVGDGVNDAPALAAATVGIAMGGGTDVALETAGITLMTSDPSRLIEVFDIAKRCYRVIMFNFWGTIVVDTLGVALAFCGLLAPIIAALIHVGSELAFILNSARLFRSSVRS